MVPQIVKADVPQPVGFQQPGEPLRNPVGLDQVAHLVHKEVPVVPMVVAVAAELAVVGLLCLQCLQALGKGGHQRQGAQAGLGLGPVCLHQLALAVDADSGDDVPDGQCVGGQVEGLPPRAQHLAPAQPVEGCELDDDFQPMTTGGFKQLFHLLGGVVGGQVLLRLGPFYLVHRVAGDQIQLHGVFQRLVQVGVQPQYAGGFQRFQLVEVETLDVPRL